MAEVFINCPGSDLEKGEGASELNIDAQSLTPSPKLSRRTQEEVVAENDTTSGEDPDNYPLHSPWSFWYDR